MNKIQKYGMLWDLGVPAIVGTGYYIYTGTESSLKRDIKREVADRVKKKCGDNGAVNGNELVESLMKSRDLRGALKPSFFSPKRWVGLHEGRGGSLWPFMIVTGSNIASGIANSSILPLPLDATLYITASHFTSSRRFQAIVNQQLGRQVVPLTPYDPKKTHTLIVKRDELGKDLPKEVKTVSLPGNRVLVRGEAKLSYTAIKCAGDQPPPGAGGSPVTATAPSPQAVDEGDEFYAREITPGLENFIPGEFETQLPGELIYYVGGEEVQPFAPAEFGMQLPEGIALYLGEVESGLSPTQASIPDSGFKISVEEAKANLDQRPWYAKLGEIESYLTPFRSALAYLGLADPNPVAVGNVASRTSTAVAPSTVGLRFAFGAK